MCFQREGETTLPSSRDEAAWAKHLLVVFSLHSSRGASIARSGWSGKFGGEPFMTGGWMEAGWSGKFGGEPFMTGGWTEATTKEEQQQNAVQDSESQSWSTSDVQVAGLARTRTDNRRCTHVAAPQSR